MLCDKTSPAQLLQPVIKITHPFFYLILPTFQRAGDASLQARVTCHGAGMSSFEVPGTSRVTPVKKSLEWTYLLKIYQCSEP